MLSNELGFDLITVTPSEIRIIAAERITLLSLFPIVSLHLSVFEG